MLATLVIWLSSTTGVAYLVTLRPPGGWRGFMLADYILADAALVLFTQGPRPLASPPTSSSAFYVRAHHPLLIAVASNAPAILAAFSAPSFLIFPSFIAGSITLVYSIILRRTLVDLYAATPLPLPALPLTTSSGPHTTSAAECGAHPLLPAARPLA